MFKYFSFKRKRTDSNRVNSLIVTKLDRIIELLEQKQNEGAGNTFHFDHVELDQIENMIFRLDSIEIDQLSGKLIIGNHISSTEDLAKTLHEKVDKEMAKKQVLSETSSLEKKMEKTSKGYRIRKEDIH
ncbi:hypothetical protein [Neobacillus muris]|uniref:hypothetical protein n=1 Tax=Neobacillus muris TaxID=2941334 RepID=UPI002040ECE2|nr:hypothetical protein [Neobacillus muris]